MTQVYASVRQSDLPGYPGCQCTTVALAAILHWELVRKQGRSRPTAAMVNEIMRTGNRLHNLFRDVYQLSVEGDNRVAIDDLPLDRYLTLCNVFSQRKVVVKRSGDIKYVCTSEMQTFGNDIMSLKQMLINAKSPSAFLVTCGDLSQAIFKRDDEYELFDSHGFIKIYMGHKVKPKGSIFRFLCITEFDKFIVSVHGEGSYMQVAELTVRPEP
ncbi:uncharacterized protein LOC127848036 [Dreissena polymorpha]|nr:uncharacterized protein LOC127848036 [Dreissena polymorpha]